MARTVRAMNVTPTLTNEQVRHRQEIVYAQNAGIVDTQRPALIPLEVRNELHHRADPLSVRYCQWLRGMASTTEPV